MIDIFDIKNMLKKIFILSLLLMNFLQAQDQRGRIAVLQIHNKTSLKAEEVSFLSAQIQQKIQVKAIKRYQVMTQENILALLPPNQTLEDCTLTECEVDTGRLLGADLIVTGQLLKFGTGKESLRLTLKLHETATGNLLLSHTIKANNANDLENKLEKALDGMIDKGVSHLDFYLQTQQNAKSTQAPKENPTILGKAVSITDDFDAYLKQLLDEWNDLILNNSSDDLGLVEKLQIFLNTYQAHPFQNPLEKQIRSAIQAIQAKKLPMTHIINWVAIPSGSFEMGGDALKSALPKHQVNLKGFYISKNEITIAQYQKCVDAGVCTSPSFSNQNCYLFGPIESSNEDSSEFFVSEEEYIPEVTDDSDEEYSNIPRKGILGRNFSKSINQPVVCVSWYQARAFAKWIGGDLPTEAQWEYVAKSAKENSRYPWGNDYSADFIAIHSDTSSEVCSRPSGNSKQGVCDMIGNVWEWVLDDFHQNYELSPRDGKAWCAHPDCDFMPRTPKTYRGGGWFKNKIELNTIKRHFGYPSGKTNHIGFRVVISL